MEKKLCKKVLVSVSVFAFLAITPQYVSAASLYFSPSSGTHAVGATFSVSVYVSSADQAMNAASGVISFPRDTLEVVSISKAASIFSLWVQEPSFSNSAGVINFEGIVLNPGFTGAGGKIASVTFKVKAAGTAPLSVSSGSVLANDGKGTNILTDIQSAQFRLGGALSIVPESTTPSVSPGTPSAPVISSVTHPDPNAWYSVKNAKFSWAVPSGITGVRLLVGKIPRAVPTVLYDPAISEKEIRDLGDGVYYFHAQFRNSEGWGEVSHFRFQIDTQPPELFKIEFVDGKEMENPRPTALFATVDSLSGVDYYKVKIGESDFYNISMSEVESNPYTLPLQDPGKKTILVQAFDKAGNYATDTEEFTVKPLVQPVITEYPKELKSGEVLKINGTSMYPQSQVAVWLQREKDTPFSQNIKSDENGSFAFIAKERLRDGIYVAWVQVIDDRGAKSEPSEKITIAVEPQAIFRTGALLVNILAVLVPLAALLASLLYVLWYGWHRFTLLRKKIKKEVWEAESALHKAFDLLKEDIEEQVKMLERARHRRQLTQEEEKIIRQFKKHLDEAEKFVKKEIADIEKAAK